MQLSTSYRQPWRWTRCPARDGHCSASRVNAPRSVLMLLALAVSALAPAAGDGLPQWQDEALSSPAVQAGEQRLEAARYTSSAAAFGYAGSGSAGAEHQRFEDRHFVGAFTPDAFAAPAFDREFTRYAIRYAVPLDLFGVIAVTRRAADSDRDAAELALRQQQLLSLHALTANYAQLVALRLRGAALDTQAARIGQTVERVQRQLDNGDAATADLRLAEAERARVGAEAERLGGARARTLAAITALIGRDAGDPGGPLPALPRWDFAAPGDSALPVAGAARRADSATAQAQRARRALYPALSAVGEYARFDSGPEVPETWVLGARLSLPIDPAGWSRASAMSSEAEAARSDVEAARRQLREQTAALATQYRSAQAEALALRAERDAMAEVVAVQTELHRVGMASLEELLRHERDLREAEAQLAEAQAQALIAWSSQAVLNGLSVAAYRAALAP